MIDHGSHDGELLVDCQLRAAVDLLAHTWDLVVLAALRRGSRRRRDLRAAIGGVSDKVLTDVLRRLLTRGLVERSPHGRAGVEYGLTGLGASLVDGPVRALGTWIHEHGEEVLEAEDRAAVTLRAAF